MKAECAYFPACTGCQYIGEDIELQKNRKAEDLKKYLSSFYRASLPIEWISAGHFGLRDRLEFIWEQGRLGLYSHEKKQILDLESCGQLSPELASWYSEFRKIKWPIKKGSVRLRVGPRGIKGVWLDFANEDIKNLLEEKNILNALLTKAVVEIGQKRKILKNIDGALKLKDPEPHIWFESLSRDQKIPLYCFVGSFTQPSLRANQALLKVLSKWVKDSGLLKASEFGSGIGNLSMMLLGWVEEIHLYESEALSLEAFKKTLETQADLFSGKKIQFHVGNFQKQHNINFTKNEILLVNPPRAGLKDFLLTIENSPEKPRVLIYMSCSPESWSRDAVSLTKMGYQLQKLSIVDQFPQTSHYEVLSYWEIKETTVFIETPFKA